MRRAQPLPRRLRIREMWEVTPRILTARPFCWLPGPPLDPVLPGRGSVSNCTSPHSEPRPPGAVCDELRRVGLADFHLPFGQRHRDCRRPDRRRAPRPPAVWRAENSAGFLYPFVEPTEHTGHGRGLSPAAITPAPLHHGHSSPSCSSGIT